MCLRVDLLDFVYTSITTTCEVIFSLFFRDRRKMKYAYDNRFSSPPYNEDERAGFSFYGDGYFKFTTPSLTINAFNFSICPQPFKQSDPTLVLLMYDEQVNVKLNLLNS